MLTRSLAVIGAALAVTTAATPPAAAAARCDRAKGRTLDASSQARAYVRGGVVYACARRARKRSALGLAPATCEGSSSGCDTVERVRVAGRFVAWARVTSGGSFGDEQFSLHLRDVVTGERWMRLQFGSPGVEDARLQRLILVPSGSMGWSFSRTPERDGEPAAEVWRGGVCSTAVLDAGPEVDGDSLTRSGPSMGWRRAGEPRSAPICPD